MALYTKVGDGGSTRMPDGKMDRKCDPRLEAIGHIDELNSHIGGCVQAAWALRAEEIVAALAPLQGELFVLGALAANPKQADRLKLDGATARMERQIDEACARMPELKHFVIPGGSELACRLHVARTVCRRCERRIVAACDGGVELPAAALAYINRLSDLLFALARLANHLAGEAEKYWHG